MLLFVSYFIALYFLSSVHSVHVACIYQRFLVFKSIHSHNNRIKYCYLGVLPSKWIFLTTNLLQIFFLKIYLHHMKQKEQCGAKPGFSDSQSPVCILLLHFTNSDLCRQCAQRITACNQCTPLFSLYLKLNMRNFNVYSCYSL